MRSKSKVAEAQPASPKLQLAKSTGLHKTLVRQLKRLQLDEGTLPSDQKTWQLLLARISRAYTQSDQDRYLLERSVNVSSAEMAEVFERLRHHADELESRVAERTHELQSAKEALERQNTRLEALYEVGNIVNSSLDIEVVLTRLTQEAVRRTQATHGQVLIVRKDLGCFERHAQWGFSPDETERARSAPLPLEKGINGRVFRTRQTVVEDDVYDSTGYFPLIRSTRTEIAVPIILENEVIGNLDLQSPDAGAFRNVDLAFLNALASQAAIAIHNARLYKTMRERALGMELFAEIGRQTTGILELDELLRETVELVSSAFGVMATHILFVQGSQLVVKASTSNMDDIPPIRIGVEGVTGWVAAHGKPLVVPDVSREIRFVNLDNNPRTRSEMSVPIKVQDVVIGVLDVEDEQVNAFGDENVSTLQAVADQLAVAIQNARLYQELEDYSEFLEDSVRVRTAELQREKQEAEAVLIGAGEAIFKIADDGTIDEVNPAFEEQTGYSQKEVTGLNLLSLASSESQEVALNNASGALAAGAAWRGELVMRRKDGTEFEASISMAPLPQDDQTNRAYVTVMRDISAHREVERMKDRFVSNISHELRTPLTSLKLFLGLMEAAPAADKPRLLETLNRETDRLHLIIEDVLALSTLDQGQVEMGLKLVNLNSMAEQIVADRQVLASEHGITLRLGEQATGVSVVADESLLSQALSSILTNALNYTPEGGEVVVGTAWRNDSGESVAGWAGLVVSDNGPGIAPQDQAQLFQRFFRGHAARESGSPGTGLGLAIAKEIIDRHEGHIEVQSEGLKGKGSTFMLWIPVDSIEGEGGT